MGCIDVLASGYYKFSPALFSIQTDNCVPVPSDIVVVIAITQGLGHVNTHRNLDRQ